MEALRNGTAPQPSHSDFRSYIVGVSSLCRLLFGVLDGLVGGQRFD